MPSLTEVQNTAITLMDYLYFHDIASLSTYSEDKDKFFSHFSNSINEIILTKKYQGERACLYQHFLLCCIEISVVIPCPTEVENFEERFEASIKLLEKVECDAKKHGFDLDELRAYRHALSESYQLASLPKELLYKLVAQYLHFKYGLISIVVFNKFLDLKILKSSRYRSNCKKKHKYNSDDIFFSAMLFVEFETYKKKMYVDTEYKDSSLTIYFNEPEEKINDAILFVKSINKIKSLKDVTYQSIADVDVNSKKCMEKYIKECDGFLNHNILFFKNISLCIGLLGSWFVNHLKETNANRAIHTQPPSDDIAENNSCTVEAKELMSDYGFLLHESRTFNDHYNKFNSHYELIKMYFRSSSEVQTGVFTSDVINYFFFLQNKL